MVCKDRMDGWAENLTRRLQLAPVDLHAAATKYTALTFELESTCLLC